MHYFSKNAFKKKMGLLSRHDLQLDAAIKRQCSQKVTLSVYLENESLFCILPTLLGFLKKC